MNERLRAVEAAVEAADQVRADVEAIGPAEARVYIGEKRQNRYLSRPYVDRLAGAMERGEWSLNGEAIKTDLEDKVFDGQHRLEAILRSGVRIVTVVVHGLDPRSVETVDMGRRRTLADILALREENSAHRLASGVVFYWRYRNTTLTTRGISGRKWPTPQQSLDLLETKPDIREGILWSDHVYRHIKLSPSVALGMFQAFADVDLDHTLKFYDSLAHDRELPADDPRTVFRRQVASEWEAQARTHTRPWREREAAWMVKAWNAWRQGELVTTPFRWVPGTDRGEPFPRPL